MDVRYTLVARRGEHGITLTLLDPLSIPPGAHTPLRFMRADGIAVLADIYWPEELPTPAERDAVIARIHRIAGRDDPRPRGPDWEGEGCHDEPV